jgi:beta-glucanase (GH16 family)
MDPPRRAASYASSRRSESNSLGDVEQSGRSESSLQAEKAAVFLRGARTEGATGDARPTTPTGETASRSSNKLAATSEFDFAFPKSAQQQPLSQVNSTDSSTPSTASPASPNSSDGVFGGINTDSSGSLARPSASPLEIRGGKMIRIRKPPGTPFRRPQHQSTPDLHGLAARSSSSPMTYQDLGTDYTRYYNPFLEESRRSSVPDKQASTPRNGARTIGTTTPLAAIYPANPFLTPNVSTTRVNALYDPEKNISVIDDRLTAPYEEKGMAAWPLIGDKEESDDEMHMPHQDDDVNYKPRLKDHFNRESISSTIGLAMMIIGLLFIFIALPVMSFTGAIRYNSSWGVPSAWLPHSYAPKTWATVNNRLYPIFENMRHGLIDRDTPQSAMHRKGEFGDEYELVFSDEFNDNNRTFYEGDDPYFYAGDFWYGATQDLEWYDPDAVTTYDGTLELRLDRHPNHGLQFRSGMLNSWNQLCFKGGIFEVSVSLPGPAGVPGLWPGAWTMGNLGRPGYLSTTDGLWPYTYQGCDAGITPNQSSSDGLSFLPGQRLPSCTCPGEDHPTPGKGRGAPEIDIIEVGSTYGAHPMPIATQSYQVAPFDLWWYPDYNYTAVPDNTLSGYNGYTGGPYQQALSATTMLNRTWYDGIQYQRYSFEYAPGEGEDAFISWKIGDQTMWMLDGRAIRANGNVAARQISEEPMSLVLNLGFSHSWTWFDEAALRFPTVMRVDYVRWYQKKGETMVTCDPPGFETTQYIKDHLNAYTNPNLTVSGHGADCETSC